MDFSPIRRLPLNSAGKDYVVGDLHGCFNLLENLLAHVNFNTACDRLFSVGDLIDRGPDSLRCLRLLAEPWFYSVKGNHEMMMWDFFVPYLLNGTLEKPDSGDNSDFLDNGGDWVGQYYDLDCQCMTEEFNRHLKMALAMPLIWLIGEGEHRFHVIHAELFRPDYRTSKQLVWLDSDIDNWFEKGAIDLNVQDRLFWGRTLIGNSGKYQTIGRIQEGLSMTFCGHSIIPNPQQICSHLYIDTGAFLSSDVDQKENNNYGLTLFSVQETCWFRTFYAGNGEVCTRMACFNISFL